MQIIIPMSGEGQRFVDAGYKDPKPLIVVDGMPIIQHVVNLFPGEHDFTFICNERHLETTNMRAILQSIAPQGKIISIPPHKKGPVYAVAQIFGGIRDEEEVVVNYCDFSTYWDYKDFLVQTRSRNADGAIAAYRGFHPHMLGSTNYAFMREQDQWMLEIKEKEPFTTNRMQEYASNGTYYFKSGSLVKKYFKQLVDEDVKVNGEFYVSLVYNLLVKDGLRVSIYEIEHMLQWGTPQDLQEYQMWSHYFMAATREAKQILPEQKSINLIPLAGHGKRFSQVGHTIPKPLIPVRNKPMILQAAESLPDAEKYIFVCLREHYAVIEKSIKDCYSKAKIVVIDQVTQGQACTCEIGLQGEDLESPLFIGACDNGMLWDQQAYQQCLEDKTVDALVWTFRHHPASARNPQMYGWVKADAENTVLNVSVKKPISEHPWNDHAIIGAFYFRKARYFLEALEQLYKKNSRINGEFYVDSCINELVEMNLTVKAFEVDYYVCWGTPQDLQTYEYWQKFFHKCWWHSFTDVPCSTKP
jgi:Nucleoside-diphosphate-sugar pyrophosphorylase involved in lipopolysaccharide biosynthesis/translation initiation factor 2B, gamma/epsilon subunits (eIF-2Bgamma/eIF-2Bepsilon)